MKTLSRQGVMPPQVARHLPAGQIGAPPLEEYNGVAIGDGTLENHVADSLIFEKARLRRVIFIRMRVMRLRLTDARLDGCDLTAVNCEQAHLRRVEVSGCRMWGANLYKAQIEDARFEECSAENAVFTGAVFKGVRFEGCNLTNVSFPEADLTGATFVRCDLSGVDLRGAKLKGADLRTCILDGLRVNAADLRGAIVEPAQTITIARLLGIEVKAE